MLFSSAAKTLAEKKARTEFVGVAAASVKYISSDSRDNFFSSQFLGHPRGVVVSAG